eukprot:scaffold73360_cov61-Cyclotella_meneghiniana.AAC.13
MEAMKNDTDLKNNLSVVAHLMHGSLKGRFSITYCPGHLSKSEVERVGFKYANLITIQQKYNFETLKDGWNTIKYDDDGVEEEFYYISNPALVLGLWVVPSCFEDEGSRQVDASMNSTSTYINIDTQVGAPMSSGVGGWKQPPR